MTPDVGGIGGTLVVLFATAMAGGAGYKFLQHVIDLWSTSDARTSSSWREYAEKLEGQLDETNAALKDLRKDLDAERKTRIEQEEGCAKRISDMWKHVARLERIIRDAGLHLPGDTPPGEARTVPVAGPEK